MKKLFMLLSVTIVAVFALSATVSFAGDGRCVRCGMIVANSPEWAGISKDAEGEKEYCSPKCLLLSYPADSDKKAELSLNDYYSTKPIDAQKAFFVGGSDIMGPMGPDLVPFGSKTDAEAFMKEHKGKTVYSYEELTLAKLKSILPMKHKHHKDGKKHHKEHMKHMEGADHKG